MSEENELRYRVTPKGALMYRFGKEQADEIWAWLNEYARGILDYREERGIPCIVLDGGGAVIAVHKETIPPPPPGQSPSPPA
ncbi:MAG TPA: hypothetical protein VHE61_20355 [Opitutaceae bacterium]|nr:hypothetical protein [Opitutaceae bacterium]